MKSFHIGRVLGINIKVHFLFVLFIAVIGFLDVLRFGIFYAFLRSFFLLLIFFFVFLHELGHSIVAKIHNINVEEIIIWPLGGLAIMDSYPKDSLVEIKIAISGPLVNLLLAIVLSPIAILAFILFDTKFFAYLIYINLILMFFNILPAFPMDGGRIYRAWLFRKLDFFHSTKLAVELGKKIAIILGFLGIIFEPWLILIAIFIFISGDQELKAVESMNYYNNSFNYEYSNHFVFKDFDDRTKNFFRNLFD